MSLSPNEKYPGATEADPNYKDGKFKDNNPSTTNNGSPLKAIDRNEQLALQEAVMDTAGFEYNGTVDTPENSQMFAAYKAALSNGANLLSNHNFLIPSPDDSQPAPSATPTSYPPGYEIFSGVFANETSGISNLTYIDGRVSFSGGDFYMPVANTGGLERLTEFVASVADFDGKPRTRGVSFALVGDEYRVTVGVDALEDESANATPLGSVKFEQGSVATGHEVQSAKGQVYTFSSVAEMITNGAPVGSKVSWLGYYSASDGGSNWGTVKRGAHTEDGGSIFSIDSNTYVESNIPSTLNVKKFGAMGESFNDDQTIQIQRAINKGRKIRFSRRADGTGGSYGIYDTDTSRRGLYPQPNTHFEGVNRPELRLMSSACNCISNILPDFYDRPVVASGKDNITIKGILFNGNATNLADPSTIGAIPVAGAPDIPAEQGDNFSYGVYIVLAKNIKIKDCEFTDFWYGGHNLFGVDGQEVKGNKYSDIGKPDAFYTNYTAMGSDGTPGFPSRNVKYISNEIKNCGGALRANGGLNNGPVEISDMWVIRCNTADNLRTRGGFSLFRGRYENVSLELNRVEGSDGRGISITGDGESLGEVSTCKDIFIKENRLSECCRVATGQAVIYAFAGDGIVDISKNSIYARHGNQSTNDSIVISGEYDGSGITYGRKYNIENNIFDAVFDNHINSISTPATHIHSNEFIGIPNEKFIVGSVGYQPFVYRNSFASPLNVIGGSYTKGYLQDNTGYKTSSYGLDTISNNSKIPHGIYAGAPPIIQVTPRADTPLQVTAVADADDLTFYVKNADGTGSGDSVSVAWSCKHWVEFEHSA